MKVFEVPEIEVVTILFENNIMGLFEEELSGDKT